MIDKRWLFMIIVILSLIPFSYAAHYITGIANNALDGHPANGKTVTLWNYLNGLNDNITDVIGPTGNAGYNNLYLIDCELLNNGCSVGNILTVKIFNDGSDYPAEERNVTVTGAGFDLVSNMTLNSPPEVELISPVNHANLTSQVTFNCSLSDLDSNLENVSLYGNWSGGWHLNESVGVSPGEDYVDFSKTLSEGTYVYSCRVYDNLSVSNFSESNNTINVDITPPEVTSVLINESYVCGYTQVRVNCTATDDFTGIDKIIIQGITFNQTLNYSGIFLTGNTYYADIILNQTTSWSFNCIVNDSVGNTANLTSETSVSGYSSSPDLYINYTSIFLSEENPIENQSVIINASVQNLGCGDFSGGIIGYFKGDPESSGENIGNDTVNVLGLSNNQTNISWNADIGKINIFLYVDFWEEITEFNESNNKANKSFSIPAWQDIYGNMSVEKIIGTSGGNLERWQNISLFNGNVFLTDSECNVNWISLQALGRTIAGGISSNDFSEIDSILSMQNFEDSISKEYTTSQTPNHIQTFNVHDSNITNVPVINSTNNSNFVTGILWDYSDDVDSDNEYDSSDKEDVVFVTRINQSSQGFYGTYDYEITFPVKMREYKKDESSQIYLYYDLN